jgi:Domain of unknown function (DUF4328)/Septum formation/zinc-ribbon domain
MVMTESICPACRTELPAGANFCPRCGRFLKASPDASLATAADPLPAARIAMWSLGAVAGGSLVFAMAYVFSALLQEPFEINTVFAFPIVAGIAVVIAWLTAAISWMVWQRRLHSILPQQALSQRHYGANSIFWWLVPIANLIIPPMAIRELSAAARPEGAPAGITKAWWAGWVLSALSVLGAVAISEPLQLPITIIASLVLAVTAVLAILVIKSFYPVGDTERSLRGGHAAVVGALFAGLTTVGAILIYGAVELVMAPLENAFPEAVGSVAGAAVGTCFNENLANPIEIEVTDCELAHDAQFYALLTYDASEDYPGDSPLAGWAGDHCFLEFGEATGEEYYSSELDFWYFFPSQQTWDEGDRTVQCYLVKYTGLRIIGSRLAGGG